MQFKTLVPLVALAALQATSVAAQVSPTIVCIPSGSILAGATSLLSTLGLTITGCTAPQTCHALSTAALSGYSGVLGTVLSITTEISGAVPIGTCST